MQTAPKLNPQLNLKEWGTLDQSGSLAACLSLSKVSLWVYMGLSILRKAFRVSP